MIGFRATISGVARKIRGLKSLQKEDFLRDVGPKDEGDAALRFLTRIFPKSKGGSANSFGGHLVEGWKSSLILRRDVIDFRIQHTGDKNNRIHTILQSLDKGSKAHEFVPTRDIVFFGKYKYTKAGSVALRKRKGWVTLKAGKSFHRPARSGERYTARTYAYIADVLIPKMKARAKRAAKERMSR